MHSVFTPTHGTNGKPRVCSHNKRKQEYRVTIKHLPLSEESAHRIVTEICSVPLEDGMTFEIMGVTTIMDDANYPGVQVMMNTTLETMRTPLKIDFSTGDAITPCEVEYSFQLLFEDRAISIPAYNLETVLAEKLETLLSRGTANTRMRDFYDIYALQSTQSHNIDCAVFAAALANTSAKRGSAAVISDTNLILDEIESSPVMAALWYNYQRKFEYAADVSWDEVMLAVRALCDAARS